MDRLSSCANDSLRFLSRSFCREGRQQTIHREVLCVLCGYCSISHSFCREGRQQTRCAVCSVWELLHLSLSAEKADNKPSTDRCCVFCVGTAPSLTLSAEKAGNKPSTDIHVLCFLCGNCSISRAFHGSGRHCHLRAFYRCSVMGDVHAEAIVNIPRPSCHQATTKKRNKKKSGGSASPPRCGRNSMMKKRWSRAD